MSKSHTLERDQKKAPDRGGPGEQESPVRPVTACQHVHSVGEAVDEIKALIKHINKRST